MPYINIGLPEYPCVSDVWDVLKAEQRPIVVYGMGNGADKLFRRFEKYRIAVSDVFASDGFVRGHSFRGFKVLSFSEIKSKYDDFVIVLSFASNRPEVVDMLAAIDAEYDMYVPDMPVTDEAEYFDREFYNANYKSILNVYNNLSDDESKMIYASVLNYKLSGKMSYLLSAYTEKTELYSLVSERGIKTVVDAGAYNGDTAKEAIEFFDGLKNIYAIEPDRRNFKKLSSFAETASVNIVPINAACWSSCTSGNFSDSGNRNSSVDSTASYQHKEQEIRFISIDSLALEEVDYIKYDVEGAEYEAILGSRQTIESYSPVLLVSLYHRSRDIFFLPELLMTDFRKYDFYIRRLFSVPAWELDLIMIPRTESCL